MRATSVLRDRVPVVVVVGGGASGTLTAVRLLRRAATYGTALEVVLDDRDGRHGMGRARPDALRLGLDADENGAVVDAAGHPHERIFTLGPLLRGVRYETTAIPEIRDQAAELAPRLLQAIACSAGPANAGPGAGDRPAATVLP